MNWKVNVLSYLGHQLIDLTQQMEVSFSWRKNPYPRGKKTGKGLFVNWRPIERLRNERTKNDKQKQKTKKENRKICWEK